MDYQTTVDSVMSLLKEKKVGLDGLCIDVGGFYISLAVRLTHVSRISP